MIEIGLDLFSSKIWEWKNKQNKISTILRDIKYFRFAVFDAPVLVTYFFASPKHKTMDTVRLNFGVGSFGVILLRKGSW